MSTEKIAIKLRKELLEEFKKELKKYELDFFNFKDYDLFSIEDMEMKISEWLEIWGDWPSEEFLTTLKKETMESTLFSLVAKLTKEKRNVGIAWS